jgi:L-iditol 2-dehydrogenase
VLVTGAGPVGLVAAQSALALGAASVAVTDVNPNRLALALDLGVTEALDVSGTSVSETGLEVDVLLECSGHPGATADAVRAVAPSGSIVLVGMGGDEATLPVSRIQERELRLTGTFRYAHTWPAAIALAASGRVQLDRLVSGHYGLDEVRTALSVARTDPQVVKPMVVPCR